MPAAASLIRYFLLISVFASPLAIAQEDATPPPRQPAAETETTSVNDWDRLIYVPFKELSKVFNSQDASAVIPYSEYIELLKSYMNRDAAEKTAIDAIITQSRFDGTVEKEVVRLTAEFKITVLKENGWARLPLNFGNAAVGKVTSDDEENTILRGVSDGKYELLLKKAGQRVVEIELLATVKTSPENRSFALSCPSVSINELTLAIPEPDQSIEIAPLQVLLPVEGSEGNRTVIKASLGSTNQFEVRWSPEAGSKPLMDLLTSATNHTEVRMDPGLVQSTASVNFEVLRGELTEVSLRAPVDARIIDVVSSKGRIKNWTSEPAGDSHQKIRIELLTPVSDRFQVEIQTERTLEGDTIQLIGKSEDGKFQGVHADGTVRESGQIRVTADSSLTSLVRTQSGVKRTNATTTKGSDASSVQAWDFSGTTGVLVLQVKPVEPRLLADQTTQIIFDDDELRLKTHINYVVERAGVFQLRLSYPSTLTIDNVRADGMSEFNIDKSEGVLTLSLTQKRIGEIGVDITAHQSFDSAGEGIETQIPTIAPLDVERDQGQIAVFAPQFLDVVTVDEKLSGLFPTEAGQVKAVGMAVGVATWKYTQRPFVLAVKTSARPAQINASTATTVSVEPDVVKVSGLITFQVQNAGIDTYRLSVPESIADDVRFSSANPARIIQQRNKAAEAIDGWVTWTLVLQNEVTGPVQFSADWEIPLAEFSDETDEHTLKVEPIRVLPPFEKDQADKRKVTLTQTRGELKLLRHESLSISATGDGDTIESIDVRELELLPQSGYLAFRYFSQPAAAIVSIRKHEIHEVVATVVSRAAFEIVTDKQMLANYRCRLRITSSERQRLRIDLPAGADLQAPLLNTARTTFEKAQDATTEEGWEAYYVNISRSATSDEQFLLTFQFGLAISNADRFPYEGRGSKQILRLPLIGENTGGAVVQETRVAVWAPKDIAQVGEPRNFSLSGRQVWNFWTPLVSPTSPQEAQALNQWIGDNSASADFAQQGNVSVYRALGRQSQINIVWWNRPFLVAIISGALLFVGLILRRTSWENRLTLTIIGCMAWAFWSLKDSSEAFQFLSAGSYGLLAVIGIWIAGLFLGQKTASEQPPENNRSTEPTPPTPEPPQTTDGPSNAPPQEPPNPAPAESKSLSPETIPIPPGAISPSPGVSEWMNSLMGGK
ncbi:MAG: hypothetical protein WAO83_24360 [Fuerstiella sp.]